MKKAILSIIMAAMVMPTMAQYDGPGYYRVKNKGAAKRYISIINNKVEQRAKEVELSAGYAQEISVWSLATVKDPITDPGTVVWISGSSSDLALEAKGMQTKQLLGQYKLMINGSSLMSEAKGTQVYLADSYEKSDDNGVTRIITNKVAGEYGQYKSWEILKIDNKEEYFAVEPELKVGDKYYTTLYASFPYELPEGVKAYYVDDHEYAKSASPVAELKEIADNVPAATPVILECTSDKAADNILKPLEASDAPAAVEDNELSGIYFCGYMIYKGSEKEWLDEDWYLKEWRNVTEYNDETMRVLGTDKDGNLALMPATDSELVVTDLGKYLPANKAYFKINEKEADVTKGGIRLLGKDDFKTATAIMSVTNGDQNAAKQGVFTLTGTRVANGSTKNLSKGIYIVNGKKMIVK